MAKLIRNRRVAADSWQLLKVAADGAPPAVSAEGDVIVPLKLWLARRDALAVLSVVRASVPNCYFLAHLAVSRLVVFRFAAHLRYHGFSEMQAFSLRYADYLQVISRAPAPMRGAYMPNKLYFSDSQKCLVVFVSI